MSLTAILKGSAGFRSLANMLSTFMETLQWNSSPSHSILRQWLQKLGLYKLQRTLDHNKKWVLITDITIQMGPQKALLVLAVPAENGNYCPNFESVEPVVLKVVTSSPGEIVEEALKEACNKVGNVVAIVSDEAAEMKRGVRLLVESGTSVIHLSDVTHMVNNCLKAELNDDGRWEEFRKFGADLIQKLKLSAGAHLSPPKQRSKARMLAAVGLINWGLNF